MTLKILFNLQLRQVTGLVASLLKMAKLGLASSAGLYGRFAAVKKHCR